MPFNYKHFKILITFDEFHINRRWFRSPGLQNLDCLRATYDRTDLSQPITIFYENFLKSTNQELVMNDIRRRNFFSEKLWQVIKHRDVRLQQRS